MNPQRPWRVGALRLPLAAMAIIAVLVIGLLGGLFHHHQSESEASVCSYCHAGVQTPVGDLANALTNPSLESIGTLDLPPYLEYPSINQYSTLIPRAPPQIIHPALFWEGYAEFA